MSRATAFSLAVLLLVLAGLALAQGSYDLSWWTVDGGGGISQGNGFTLQGTVAQPDAGAMAGGNGFVLSGGFWYSAVSAVPSYRIFLPLVLRSS